MSGESFDYAVVRVVPRVERHEFVNVGVIVHCRSARYLEARVHLDGARVALLDPAAEIEVLARHLSSIPLICRGGPEAGPIGRLPQTDRFHWLVAPRSTVIQTSPVHVGLGDDGDALLERLFAAYVVPPRP